MHSSKTDYYYNLVILDEYGNSFETPLNYKIQITFNVWERSMKTYSKVGRVSENYFFFEDAFYNLAVEKVLDLQGVEIDNRPYFEDGCCWIEYRDSGALWGAYIDIHGNFLGNPMKLYDL